MIYDCKLMENKFFAFLEGTNLHLKWHFTQLLTGHVPLQVGDYAQTLQHAPKDTHCNICLVKELYTPVYDTSRITFSEPLLATRTSDPHLQDILPLILA